MNEYWLMLFLVSFGVAFAWAFFGFLARKAIWSRRPNLDGWRYGLITVCLAIEIGSAFEFWEAALLSAVSCVAYRAIRRDKARLESALRALATQTQRFAEARRAEFR